MSRSKSPRLTAQKLLKSGIHDMTLAQIQRIFGQFQGSDRRPRLFAKLCQYVEELSKTRWAVELLIDGSFVMAAVDRPEDIDTILVVPADWDFQAELQPF